MRKTGSAVLPLHGGHAPAWLVKRMKALADEMVYLIVQDRGTARFLECFSDPYWFQAFGCVLGFDWHSSGVTTVVTGVMKNVLKADRHGLVVAGGKGMASRRAPSEIENASLKMGLTARKAQELQYASRICAKVDNAAIQAGYPIYHHSFVMDQEGRWAVAQQGLNVNTGKARRYHWLSDHVRDFVVEPHDAIVGDGVESVVLNMTAKEAEENRRTCVDLAKESSQRLISSIRAIGSKPTLDRWAEGAPQVEYNGSFEMPTDLNWQVFFQLYDVQPKNYEELLAFRGVGPATVRALALVSQLVYGSSASWRDPVKFSFAHGGKDGVPFPVNRAAMDGTINCLREMLESADVERSLRTDAVRRLGRLANTWGL